MWLALGGDTSLVVEVVIVRVIIVLSLVEYNKLKDVVSITEYSWEKSRYLEE
jgi:hypothetical protein